MKLLSLIGSIFLFLCTVSGFSQVYSPTEQNVKIDKVAVTAWVFSLEDEPLDALKDGWADYVKNTLDAKVKKNGRNGLIAKEISAPRICRHTGDLKAQFSEKHQQSTVAVAFLTGYDFSINSQDNPTEAANLRMFTKQFIKSYKTNQLDALIAEEEKRERSLELDYERHERERSHLTKHITRLDRKITSEKTEDSKRFELNNEKVTAESRIRALDKIMANFKDELIVVSQTIQKYRADISHLDALFVEPLADQEISPQR